MSEDGIRRELDAISGRLDRIDTVLDKIQEHMLNSAKNSCPAPGSCIPLAIRVSTVEKMLENYAKDVDNRVLKNMNDIEKLQTVYHRFFGALVILVPIGSFAVQVLLKWLGM